MQMIKNFIKKYPLLVAFATFMLVVFVADMFATGRQFSELENRNLKQRPRFSWRSLAANEYTRKYEEFINDQFVMRDSWITLKSASENVFMKVENNGVAFGKNDYLFGVKTTADTEQLDKNSGYVDKFLGSYDGHVTVGIIPNSYEIMQSYLPMGLAGVQIKQQPCIDRIYSGISHGDMTKLDIPKMIKDSIASAEQADGIYYRTDHHWTTDTAYMVYVDYCKTRGLKYIDKSDLQGLRHEEQGFYGTYYSKGKKIGTPADSLVWYDIPVTDMTIDGKTYLENSDKTKTPITGLYQKEKFATRDKYSAFLYG
ncbi:MAG: DHHW family protein, partial [Angelakisella sp.]